jgi:excinuclease UvrABC nuclease subunit
MGTCARFDMGACLAPCRHELDGTYSAVVLQVRRVLEGHDDHLTGVLESRLQGFVAALAFEQAAKLQEQRETLTQAVRLVRRLRAALDRWSVIACPAGRPGVARLWGVAGGAVAVEQDVDVAAFDAEAAAAFLARLYAATPPRPPLAADTIDEILLLEGWLRRHREAAGVLGLQAPSPRTGPAAPSPKVAADLVCRVRLAVHNPA